MDHPSSASTSPTTPPPLSSARASAGDRTSPAKRRCLRAASTAHRRWARTRWTALQEDISEENGETLVPLAHVEVLLRQREEEVTANALEGAKEMQRLYAEQQEAVQKEVQEALLQCARQAAVEASAAVADALREARCAATESFGKLEAKQREAEALQMQVDHLKAAVRACKAEWKQQQQQQQQQPTGLGNRGEKHVRERGTDDQRYLEWIAAGYVDLEWMQVNCRVGSCSY
mmetsp:Transcript_79508/g.257505  ORF Transcript_79508/g.257505 Transcript_79508/m.257505 type:complete len:232 (+) Transcript_79508:69-764(+)